jgi:single-strand DNA-binding protein
MCPCGLWSWRTRAFRRETALANIVHFSADMPARIVLRLRRGSAASVQMRTLLWSVSAVMDSAFARALASGLFLRPAALGLLLRAPRAFGVTVPPKTSLRITAKNPVQTSFGPLPESRPSALGVGPTSLYGAPIKIGKFTNGDTVMYQNKVTLIGFLGGNAEVHTNNVRSFTTLSLATKSSYKKDGEYISQTEWHRCVVFGKLSEFAKTLTKGAHVQVEGALRSREYESKKTDSKHRVWEIRVASIMKLDRAEKGRQGHQEHDEESQEETAA